MPLSFREMSSGQFRQIPISALTKISYVNTYASINRKNQKRTITLSSNVLSGFNAFQVNAEIRNLVKNMTLPSGYEINQTGEQEDQKEASNFLGIAFFIAICLILMILVTQFNSTAKPLIIITQVIFSTIGVMLGFVIFRLTFSIVITGIGVVALAGIVVKNGIILIDFTEILKARGGRIRQNIINAGAIRFNPVILTAAATTLGVVPLAIGFNINFGTFLTKFNPHIFIGGDSVSFWGPLAWAIIFGLTFATFLTLVIVPCMYFVQHAFVVRYNRRKELKKHRLIKEYHKSLSEKE
jgi:multidrug efflux pump subunit AcrB